MTISDLVRRRTHELAEGLLGAYQEWEREAEEYRRSGYRPRTCQHGTYMWTDYDSICQGCEDGWSASRWLDRMSYALSEAKWQFNGKRKEWDGVWALLSVEEASGRYILRYLESLPDKGADIKLDASESRAYWAYIGWLLRTAERAVELPF